MKMAIIGAAGGLGSATAFCMGQRGYMDEVKMIDVRQNVTATHVMDLYQGYLEDTHTKFTVAEYSDVGDCDIFVIVASVPYNPNVTDRSVNVKVNYDIVLNICDNIKDYIKKDAIIITGTNPIEIYTYAYYKKLGLPRNQVIGFCAPDSIRMKWAIEEVAGIPYSSINAFCVGEHGKATRLYDQATVNGEPLVLTDEQKAIVEKMNLEWFAEWQSHKSGRTTTWTSSLHITKIVDAIVGDTKAILPAAVVMEGEFGINGVAMDMICTIGKDGIEKINDPNFTVKQLEDIKATEERIRGLQEQIGLF